MVQLPSEGAADPKRRFGAGVAVAIHTTSDGSDAPLAVSVPQGNCGAMLGRLIR